MHLASKSSWRDLADTCFFFPSGVLKLHIRKENGISLSHSVYVCCVVVGEQRELTSVVLRSLQGVLLHYGCHNKE